MFKICAVIIHYNEQKYLDKLFDSLEKQTRKFDKIFFVDNNSPENPWTYLKKHELSLNIEYIRNSENLFFTKGINIGLRRALKENFDIIGMMNSDMWCDPNMVEKIVGRFEENPKVIALTPNIRNLENTYRAFSPIKCRGFFGSAISVDNGEMNQYTDFLIGASAFVRSSALKKIGLFYEPYQHGTEDFEMSDKLRSTGQMEYIFSTNIYHPDKTGQIISPFFQRLNSKNWYIYCLRNKKRVLLLNFLALFKNLFTINNPVSRNRFLGQIDGIKETFYHLSNKSTYL